jgi:hypothetical protein
MSVSSYISIFDDWDLLKPSLWSVNDLVDEIVVVDGAYGWMAPYFKALGRDPARSREQVYDGLASFGKKVKVVSGIWDDETDKRRAGYQACKNRYILRNDADEVLFWDAARFEEFLSSGHAVGQMEMPIYVSSGTIRATSATSAIERQSFLFDSEKISAHQHLSYLWLVLPEAERATLEPAQNHLIFPEPIAFTAHLSHWRSPETAVNRARFYIMNYVRSAGSLGWVGDFTYTEERGFAELFNFITPEGFNDILMGHEIVAAPPAMAGSIIRPSGRDVLQDRVFAILYDNMLDGLTRLNDTLRLRPRTIVNGLDYMIDASKNSSTAAIQSRGEIRLVFSEELASAQVELSVLMADGSTVAYPLAVSFGGKRLSFALPRLTLADSEKIRRTIKLGVHFVTDVPYASFSFDHDA